MKEATIKKTKKKLAKNLLKIGQFLFENSHATLILTSAAARSVMKDIQVDMQYRSPRSPRYPGSPGSPGSPMSPGNSKKIVKSVRND